MTTLNDEYTQRPHKVLVVDDMATNRGLIKAVLCPPEYIIEEAASGEEALEMVNRSKFDLVILDILMPGIDGLEVCEQLKQNPDNLLLPVIMVTSLDSPRDIRNCLEAGATDFISKPFNNDELLARSRSAVGRQELVKTLVEHYRVLTSIARLIDARDHQVDALEDLSYIATSLGKEVGLVNGELNDLRTGSLLHDIGMLAVPDEILLKNSKLEDYEWDVVKQHTVKGAELCESIRVLRPCLPIIRSHHERWDGKGYPDGLKGEAIPLIVRVFQIADVYHAMICKRPYRHPLSKDEIVNVFENGAFEGIWDPNLVKIFLNILKNEPEHLQRKPDIGNDGPALKYTDFLDTLRMGIH